MNASKEGSGWGVAMDGRQAVRKSDRASSSCPVKAAEKGVLSVTPKAFSLAFDKDEY